MEYTILGEHNSSVTFYEPKEYAIVLTPGRYRFELWGASGGASDGSYPGKGGYISGTINIYETTEAYAYVGGA